MNVALVTWAPFLAGAEIACERLGVGLARAGHDVRVFVGTDGEALARFRDAGLRCDFVPMHVTDKRRFWRHAGTQRALSRAFSADRPDVVHFNDLPSSQMGARAAGRSGVPRVCHHRWIFDGPAIDWLNKFGAERHVFVSDALRGTLCSRSAALAAGPHAVVHDGLELPTRPDEATRVEARTRLGRPTDRVLVLFAGQVIERKGVADVLRAWSGRRDSLDSAADLVIVGDDLEGGGAYRVAMERLAAELGVSARFVGFSREVPAWLTAADVVLVPSHAEPLGNATLEAMAHARPVIGTRVGGIPEMVVDGETGLLVTPRSPEELGGAIARLVGDTVLRERLGTKARQRCESSFSLSTHVESMLAQYAAAGASGAT